MKRPISPHLSIYKPQITSITSILHRLTGVFLFLSLVIFCWLFIYYNVIYIDNHNKLSCNCLILKIFLYPIAFGLIFSIYYHLFNGIRHLFWDIGKGFEINVARRNGYIVIALSFVMTILTIFSAIYYY